MLHADGVRCWSGERFTQHDEVSCSLVSLSALLAQRQHEQSLTTPARAGRLAPRKRSISP